MTPEANHRALRHLQEIRLLTDKEHATARDDPELAKAPLRTPAEVLAWAVVRGTVPQQVLAALPARAAADRHAEALAIVSEATGLIDGNLPLPPWAQLHLRLLERRMQDGVSDTALDELLARQLINAEQHAHSLSMLPTHAQAWAAPDSLPATLAWTVLGAGSLSEADLAALAALGAHAEIVSDAAARVAGARTVTRTTSTSTSFSTSSMTFSSTSSASSSVLPSFAVSSSLLSQGRAPRRWKMIGIAVVVLIALFILFVR